MSFPGISFPLTSVRPGAPSSPPRPLRRMAASVTEDGETTGVQHANLANDTVAATVRAGAAGAGAEHVALDAQRVGELERLDGRVERVRHRDVDAGRPVRRPARALAAADRLVVRPLLGAERRVVHRALPLRRHVDRACRKAASTTSVIRLDVSVLPATTAAGDRALTRQPSGARTVTGRRRRPRPECRVGQDAYDEEARRAGHGQRTVEVPGVLRRRSGEVDLDLVARRSSRRTRISRSPSTASITSSASYRPSGSAAMLARDASLGVRVAARPSPDSTVRGRDARRARRRRCSREVLRRELRTQVAAALVRVA